MYTKDEVMTFVEEEDVKFIRLAFCDVFGNQKNISVMPDELRGAFEHGVPIDASAIPGFSRKTDADLYLFPDPSTLAILPWRPSHGRVVRMFCDIKNADDTPFEGDTRHFLKTVQEKAEQLGVDVDIGAKFEFYLFKREEDGTPTSTPADNAGYLDIAPEDSGEDVRREICLTLADMDIRPQFSHHEEGPGQHEIDFCRGCAIDAADDAVTFKAVVKTIARQNGLFATFSPKPLSGQAGNGMHLSISATSASGLDLSDSFMAGIMRRIRELTAFLNPIEESYRRLGEKKAPRFITWSPDNRTQLIRFVSRPSLPSKRIELRSPDAMSNPYLAYALLILAGLEGISENIAPPPPCTEQPLSGTYPDTALPASLDEANLCALASQFVAKSLPDFIISAYTDRRE